MFAVLALPAVSALSTRLHPTTTNEYAMPFGSTDGLVPESLPQEMRPTATPKPSNVRIAVRREVRGGAMARESCAYWSARGNGVGAPRIGESGLWWSGGRTVRAEPATAAVTEAYGGRMAGK